MANFQAAFNQLMVIEGGYVNAAGDKGGATKYGITAALYAQYLGVASVTTQQIQGLTIPIAQAVYQKMFWAPMELDSVSDQWIAYAIFDQSVNRGHLAVTRDIQTALNTMGYKNTVDGQLGPATIMGINLQDPARLLRFFCERCQIIYCEIVKITPGDLQFLEGWINRTHILMNQVDTPEAS